MSPKRWDVWWAYVYFEEDPTQGKKRPVVVLGENEENNDLINSLKVTTKTRGYNDEYILRRWSDAGLDRESTVRTKKIFAISRGDFQRRIGRLQPIDVKEIKLLREVESNHE